jgi:hypothetical protein
MNAGVNFIRIRDQLTPSGVDITNQNKYHLIDATTTDGRRLQRGYVGSYELNSTGYTNTDETMLRIDDPAFVAALNAHFEVLKSRAFYRVAVPLPDRGVPFTDALTVSSPGAAGWFNSDVTVRLFSSDAQNGTGTREVRYQLAGANTSDVVITAGERASALLTNEGVTTISYWGLDNAGNTEARKSLTVKIDKTPPVVGVTAVPLPNAAGWNNTDVTVFFTASDPLSGVGGAPSSSRTLGEGAAQLVSATFTDLAGNTSTAHYTANVDRTDPTLTGMPADDCSIWPPDHTLRAVADVAGADALSGLAGFRLVATSSEPQFGTGTGDIGPDIFISGGHLILRAERSGLSTAGRIYSVAATVTDLAGNSASQTTTCLVSHDQSQLAANAAANPDRHLRNAVDRAAARAARDQAAAAAVAAWAAAQPQPGPTTFEDTPLGVATVAEPGELGDTIADAEPG